MLNDFTVSKQCWLTEQKSSPASVACFYNVSMTCNGPKCIYQLNLNSLHHFFAQYMLQSTSKYCLCLTVCAFGHAAQLPVVYCSVWTSLFK